MRLLTVGDSFTYGEELAELTSAWPFLLGDKLGYEITNLAKPGSGNTRMVRHCVEQSDNYDIAIIAWSHFARFEMADENGFYDLWPGGGTLPHKQYSPWRWEIIDWAEMRGILPSEVASGDEEMVEPTLPIPSLPRLVPSA